ncbi:MAG TPA: alpha/beta hydrolase [Tenuifilaceae bacterium]|nr:alpha/beta hydrolase [Tenuifilaceae bacterium]
MRHILLSLNLLIMLTMTNCSSTTTYANENQNAKNAISSLEAIEINGVKQWVMIRSLDTSNPILLYFHSGPGTSELPLVWHFNSELEKHFTLVYLEQRGTVKSFKKRVFNETLSIEQFVEDGYELSKYLLKRFNQEKLFIVGHSWGTVIGTKLAMLHPELYHAYIGIGQVVYPMRGEQLSCQYAYSQAVESNNQKALEKINKPSYLTTENNPKWYKQLKAQRQWLTYFGGVNHNQTDNKQFSRIYMKSPGYSLWDMMKFVRGSAMSLKRLWPEFMTINFLQTHTEFQIPIYFIQGEHDYNCPTELVREYYQKISSPKKELQIFEQSAHNPNFEEHQKFHTWLIQNLKSNE